MKWIKKYESFDEWEITEEEVIALFSDLSDANLQVTAELNKKLLQPKENILSFAGNPFLYFNLVPTITVKIRVKYSPGEKFGVIEDLKSVLESELFIDCVEVAESRLKTKGYEMTAPYRNMDMIFISFLKTKK